ncbi:aminotransferase class V-fold PLP-dependent enzyme [candidate division KSB1 bacterium]|nr:aminotransferase class V-fold PLP-dependent enzyme [candidate division KSB1 bacterium]
MKKIYFTPGPTELYPTVAAHIENALHEDICSISHRSSRFKDIFKATRDNLKILLEIPDNFHIFFIGSATEAMERIIENCVQHKSSHLVNGAFSERFYKTALDLKKEPQKIMASFGNGFYEHEIEIDADSELICVTQNETSTGVALSPDFISRMKRRHPEKLIAVDVVSSVPYAALDYKFLDCAFFSVQKGFGLPAGLGVIIANERCIQKAQSLQEKDFDIGSYHNFPSLLKQAQKCQTSETPNVLAIYLLGKVCADYLQSGLSEIRKQTEIKSVALYEFFENHPQYKPFVKEESFRSHTIIVSETISESSSMISRAAKQGFIIGSGYGNYKNRHIRIANFPVHSLDNVKSLLVYLR